MSEPSSLVETNGLCRCGHTGKAHPLMGAGHPCTNHGCECRAFVKVPLPTIINDRCKCGHDRFRHNWGSEADGACSKPDCDCKAYAPVTVETVELPEPCEHDWHHATLLAGLTCRCCGLAHKDWSGEPCPDEAPAPPQIGPLPPPAGPEYTPCVCGHIEPEHDINGRYCATEPCDCTLYRTEPEAVPLPPCHGCGSQRFLFSRDTCVCGAEHYRCGDCKAMQGVCPMKGSLYSDWFEFTPTPQPERRPPLTVQYSVAGGHPYEVSIPGDASVTAEDGALIIKHPSAQILAITRVAPMED